MRTKVSEPTNGSFMILNARPDIGAVSLGSRTTISSVPGIRPSVGGTSSGDGRKSTTASSSGCTPLFLNAEPQITGTSLPATVPLRRQATIVASSGSLPSR